MSILDNLFGKKEELNEVDKLVNVLRERNEDNKYNLLIEYIKSKQYFTDFDLLSIEELHKLLLSLASNIDVMGDSFNIYDIKDMYDLAVSSNDDKEKSFFFKMVKNYHTNPQLFRSVSEIYNIFEDKLIVYEIYKKLVNSKVNATYIFEYIKSGKQYNYDERSFGVKIVRLIEKYDIISNLDADELKTEIEEQLKRDRHSTEGYGVDPELLVNQERQADSIKAELQKLEKQTFEVATKLGEMEIGTVTISEKATKYIQDVVKNRTKEFTELVDRCTEKVNSVEEQIKAYVDQAKDDIETAAAVQINMLDEMPKKVVKGSQKTVVNDGGPKKVTKVQTSAGVVEILSPKLYRKYISAKNPNEFYHYQFDKSLKYVLMRKAELLIGPPGAGKSELVEQIANLIGLPFYNLGYIRDEIAQITGYMDANGQYVKTPFYDAIKYGGVCFIDEIDNSESRALIEINKIISGIGYKNYLFPNGEFVEPHPNFTIVAAANTWGDGTDRQFSSREKLDPATLDRFEQIKYGYDEELEKKLLKAYPQIYQFIQRYRAAIQDIDLNLVMSTRTVNDIARYLDSGIIDWKEIVEQKFIKNIQPEYLNQILGNMRDMNGEYYKEFESQAQKVK